MKAISVFTFVVLLSPFVMAKAGAHADANELVLSGGPSGVFDTEHNPTLVAEFRLGRNWVGIHPWLGLGWATDGAVFAGGGILYTIGLPRSEWQVTAGVGPGYYERHEGVDLGSHLEFCTFAEISRNMPWGHRVMVRMMHISNGGLTERNPGNELLLLGYAMPLP